MNKKKVWVEIEKKLKECFKTKDWDDFTEGKYQGLFSLATNLGFNKEIAETTEGDSK